ncbi:unnamed protein product [Plutella xylostella]|uniref:(diamondback moth) hypothetical protein n=1 Tax=Plutella xylostella TaxID=51655 RepID=A0A8S4DBU7_PLUXY|nr:unnamed protein product [Plutella xylostella]
MQRGQERIAALAAAYISGARAAVLWGAAFVWDWLWLLLVYLCVVATLAAFQETTLSTPEELDKCVYIVFRHKYGAVIESVINEFIGVDKRPMQRGQERIAALAAAYISGVRMAVLWGAAFVWDWLWLLLVYLCVVATLAAAQETTLSTPEELERKRWIEKKNGVPQGIFLAPPFFNMYGWKIELSTHIKSVYRVDTRPMQRGQGHITGACCCIHLGRARGGAVGRGLRVGLAVAAGVPVRGGHARRRTRDHALHARGAGYVEPAIETCVCHINLH